MVTSSKSKKALSAKQSEKLLETLQQRFNENMGRHKGLQWAKVQSKLKSKPAKLVALNEMEKSGGEPDVISFEKKTNEFVFFDCCAESPSGRRSICYDDKALAARKLHKPKTSALAMAEKMGIEILTKDEYEKLQTLGEFDLKTSSWVLTPPGIRDLGGAIFCDRRFDTVFTYHNGADSYYAGRGFRASLRV